MTTETETEARATKRSARRRAAPGAAPGAAPTARAQGDDTAALLADLEGDDADRRAAAVARAAALLRALPDGPDAPGLVAALERAAGSGCWSTQAALAPLLDCLPSPAFERAAEVLAAVRSRYVAGPARAALRARRAEQREAERRARELRVAHERLARLGARHGPEVVEAARSSGRAAVGETVSELTHDLLGVQGSVQTKARLLAEQLEARNVRGQPLDLLAGIARELQRALELTQGLRHVVSPRTPAFTRVVLADAVASALSEARSRSRAGARGPAPRVRQEIDVPRHLVLEAPANDLVRAIANVVRNAFEALERGGVLRISARATGGGAGSGVGGRIVLVVEDDGPGIPASFRRFVFVPGQTLKRDRGGTGTGLVVAQRVVEGDCRGSIAVDSEEGKGTRVTISLPVERARATDASGEEAA